MTVGVVKEIGVADVMAVVSCGRGVELHAECAVQTARLVGVLEQWDGDCLCCVAVWCSVGQCGAVWGSVGQCGAV